MFDDTQIIAGLDIGTHKICVVVGEVGTDGGLNIISIGQARSRGVRKGEIVDTQRAEEDVRAALSEAESRADVEIRSVYLGVTGGHIRGFNNRGMHPVVSADREITPEDVEDVVKNAKAVNLPAENAVVHAIRQHFFVDGHEGVTNPVGMLGARLEVDMHVIHGQSTRLQNSIRLVRGISLEVEEVVFNGIASSLALLTNEQKELGALVIDLGGGTTEYVAYANGVVRHSGVLAVGGDHVTNDLAHGLKVPLSRAEKLKIDHGSALVQPEVRGQTVSYTNELGLELKRLNHEHLQRIMSLRLEEVFELIAQDLERAGLTDYLRAGVFLCGGGSHAPQLMALAEKVFQMNVTAGGASAISGLAAALDQPEFATAIGLVKFGSLKMRRRTERTALGLAIKNTLDRFFTARK